MRFTLFRIEDLFLPWCEVLKDLFEVSEIGLGGYEGECRRKTSEVGYGMESNIRSHLMSPQRQPEIEKLLTPSQGLDMP